MSFRILPRKERNSTGNWKPIFLQAFLHSGMINQACLEAGVVRQTVFYARKRDPQFAADFRLAVKTFRRSLCAAETRRRRANPPVTPETLLGCPLEDCSDRVLLRFLKKHSRLRRLNSEAFN